MSRLTPYFTTHTSPDALSRRGAPHRRAHAQRAARSTLFSVGLTLLSLLGVGLPEALALEVIVGLPYGTHKIGHTAVRVTAPSGEDVIYDFGRYGKVWGPLKMQGEGILRVWRGDKSAQRYITKQRSFRSSIGYVIALSAEEERAAYEYYEELIRTARWSKDYPLHTRHRLARDYDGVLTQCTSIALEGIKHVWGREKWERLLDPKFNVGQGFNQKVSRYYFKTQDKLKRRETVVPLDVIDSFKAELKRTEPLITKVIRYPQR